MENQLPIDGAVFYQKDCQLNEKSVSTEIYEVFPRQILAFSYFDSLDWSILVKQQVKIYCFEGKQTGKRKFLVSSWNRFFQKYFEDDDAKSKSKCHHGHFYEIIREGFPCRGYFDLEYSKDDNIDTDGNLLTSKWIQLVLLKLYEVFEITLDEDNLIVLDSSTSTKFSKHVIFNMYNNQNAEILFRDNVNVGLLIEHIMYDITYPVVFNMTKSSIEVMSNVQLDQVRQPKPEYQDLWVNTKDGRKACFVDLGVYTRNRAFRIFGCSKFGKHVTLKLDPYDRRYYHGLDLTVKKKSSIAITAISDNTTSLNMINERKRMFETFLTRSFVVPSDINQHMDESYIQHLRGNRRHVVNRRCSTEEENIELIDYSIGSAGGTNNSGCNINLRKGVFMNSSNSLTLLSVLGCIESAFSASKGINFVYDDNHESNAILMSQFAPRIPLSLLQPTLTSSSSSSSSSLYEGHNIKNTYDDIKHDDDNDDDINNIKLCSDCYQSQQTHHTQESNNTVNNDIYHSAVPLSQGGNNNNSKNEISVGRHVLTSQQSQSSQDTQNSTISCRTAIATWIPSHHYRSQQSSSKLMSNNKSYGTNVVNHNNNHHHHHHHTGFVPIDRFKVGGAGSATVVAKSNYNNQYTSPFPSLDQFIEKYIVCASSGGSGSRGTSTDAVNIIANSHKMQHHHQQQEQKQRVQGRLNGWMLYRYSHIIQQKQNSSNTVILNSNPHHYLLQQSVSIPSSSSPSSSSSSSSSSSQYYPSHLSQHQNQDVCSGRLYEPHRGISSSSSSSTSSFDLTSMIHYTYKLQYQIAHYKYCGNIGRSHKSNGIMIDVDLRRKWATQVCWDPDCRGYRSPPFLIPAELIPDNHHIEEWLLDRELKQCLETNPSFIP